MKKVLLILMVVVMVGCTTPYWEANEANDWNWSTQTGTFTFDQAKIEFGAPFYTRPSSDGGTVAGWRVGAGLTTSHSTLIESRQEMRVLQFDKDGKFVSGFGPGRRRGRINK